MMPTYVFSNGEIESLALDEELFEEDFEDFFSIFAKKHADYLAQDNRKHAYLYELLAGAVILPWYPGEKNAFGSIEQLSSYKILENGKLRSQDVEIFKKLILISRTCALKARLSDILWHFTKDHKAASTAIASYLEYAKLTDDFEDWIEPVNALTRALGIAKSLGKKSNLRHRVLGRIQKCVEGASGEDPLFYSHRLIGLLLANEYGDVKHLAELAEKRASFEETKDAPNSHLAESYWLLAAECYRKGGYKGNEQQAVISCSEMWVRVAQQESQNPRLVRFQIAYKYERAIHYLRTVEGTQGRIDELHKKLLLVQRDAREQMAITKVSLEDRPEVPRLREMAIKSVQKENFLDALVSFSQYCPSPSYQGMKQQAIELQDKYILKKLMPVKIVDAFGKTVANPPLGDEESLLADVFQHQNHMRTGYVALAVEPAREEIMHHYKFSLIDLAPIVQGNPLISYGHEYLVLKGLFAGLQGDFFTAVHLLVPQLEATFRQILQIQGRTTSKFTNQGVQDEISLNQMLEKEENFSVLTEVLSENTVFDLRGLLVDRFGANLRNKLAHGMLFDSELESSEAVYLWYLSLNIYSRPFIAAISESEH